MTSSLDDYDITLYHQFPSRSTPIKWLVIELGLNDKIKTENVDLFKGDQMKPGFKSMNPMTAVPSLRMTHKQTKEETYMTESGAISIFLTKYANKIQLQPDDMNIPATAVYHRVIVLTVSSIDPLLWDIRRHEQLLTESKRIPQVAQMARKTFTERVVPTVEALLQHQHQKFICSPHHDQFTAADVMLAYRLFWADLYDLNTSIMRTYMKRMLSRDAFQKAKLESPNPLPNVVPVQSSL